MRGMDGNETCPVCYRVMVDLRDFDPRADALGVADEPVFSYHRSWEMDIFREMLARLWEWTGACVKNRRLRRVARRWPRSLYCPGCGHIIKRR